MLVKLFSLLFLLAQCQDPSFSENPRPRGESDAINDSSVDPEPLEDEPAIPAPKEKKPDGPITDIDDETRQVKYDYSVDKIDDAFALADLESDRIENSLVMKRAYHHRKITTNQEVRSTISDTYYQGFLGNEFSESFTQGGVKKLDLLVVIDNSLSMENERTNLSTKLNPLLSQISDSDWRMGIVTTDPDFGSLTAVINKGDSNAESRFKNAILQNYSVNGNERGILQAVRALRGDGGDWVREGSSLAVLIVSDEDNCSNGNDCQGMSYQSADFLVNYLSTKWTPGANARVYGLYWHPNDSCSTADYKAYIYDEAVTRTNGSWGSICNSDYTNTLSRISSDISSILDHELELAKIPDVGSVKIYYNDVEQDKSQFSVSGNMLTLINPPLPGTVIRVEYRFDGKPIRSQFALSKSAVADTLEVYVDGNLASPSEYTFDGSMVMFTPDEHSKVDLKYKEDKVLGKVFALNGFVNQSSIKVKLNGNRTRAFTYDPNQNVVIMNQAPPEGVLIEIEYFEIGSPILSYPLLVNGQKPQNLEVIDAQTQQDLDHLYAFGAVNFSLLDWKQGKEVLIRYDNMSEGLGEINLAQTPIPSSVIVKSGNKTCKNITVKKKVVDVSACNFQGQSVEVSYDYYIGVETLFNFNKQHLPNNDTTAIVWIVEINGVETTEYVQTGLQFEITGELIQNDVVTIKAQFKK